MRSVSYIIMSCLLIFFASCHCDDNDEIDVNQPTKKTILMYLPWSGDATNTTNGTLYSNFLNNISAVENAIKSEGLGCNRLLVFICSAPRAANLIEITYNKGVCHRDTIVKYTADSTPAYTTPEGIASILSAVEAQAPAPQYAMMIGCHGSGWLPKGIDVSRAKSKPRKSFGGATTQYQTNIADLASGIRQAGMHMQFISFDDCYMAGVEVAYDLRNVTDYLIASTSEIMAMGLPYDKIFPYLLKENPDYSGVCQAFYSFYNAYKYPYGTLSAIDCSQINSVAALMKTVNSSFTASNMQLSDVQRLDGYANTVYYDFGDYLKNLCESDLTTYNQLAAAIEKLVPYKVATKQIYSMYANNYIDVNTFSGITISDATLNTTAQQYLQQTEWWAATH